MKISSRAFLALSLLCVAGSTQARYAQALRSTLRTARHLCTTPSTPTSALTSPVSSAQTFSAEEFTFLKTALAAQTKATRRSKLGGRIVSSVAIWTIGFCCGNAEIRADLTKEGRSTLATIQAYLKSNETQDDSSLKLAQDTTSAEYNYEQLVSDDEGSTDPKPTQE